MAEIMEVKVTEIAGFASALEGLSYNKKRPISSMLAVATKLSGKGDGHNKFLRQIVLWASVLGPRYWWQEFDTYKTVLAAQSESTMHTLFEDMKDIEAWADEEFEERPSQAQLDLIDGLRKAGDLMGAKRQLPEGFLQRRMVAINFLTLQHMYRQRINHRLPHWPLFLGKILREIADMKPEEGSMLCGFITAKA